MSVLGGMILVRDLSDVELVGELLELTVTTSYTCGAVAVVLGKDELYIVLSCFPDLLGVGPDDHAFFYCSVAGSGKTLLALYLDNAYTACANFIKSLPVAKGGDIYSYALGCIQDAGSFSNRYALTVNSQIYHLNSLPPFSNPQPKWSHCRHLADS